MKSQCLISFGSNLGRRDASIATATRIIASSSLVHQLKASRLFQTPPIGGPDGQEPFFNAVAAFQTEASAWEILQLLQEVEQRLGRQRDRRWDSRSIDLDVVLHGALVGGGSELTVPHPRYTARQFVLRPALDVASHYCDPRFGWTIEQLSRHLDQGVPSLALVGGGGATRREILTRLSQAHAVEVFLDQGSPPPTAIGGSAPVPQQRDSSSQRHTIPASVDRPWVSAFLPPLPDVATDRGNRPEFAAASVPRLVARLQQTTPQQRWPAPHQLWPAGWNWPEYRLEIGDLDWAVGELAAALVSMRCPVEPVTDDGRWWM